MPEHDDTECALCGAEVPRAGATCNGPGQWFCCRSHRGYSNRLLREWKKNRTADEEKNRMNTQLTLMPTPDAVAMEQLVYHTHGNHRLSFSSVWGRPHSWRPRGWSEARARRAVEDALAAGLLRTVKSYDGTYLEATAARRMPA